MGDINDKSIEIKQRRLAASKETRCRTVLNGSLKIYPDDSKWGKRL